MQTQTHIIDNSISIVDFIGGRKGNFLVIVKTRSGTLTVVNTGNHNWLRTIDVIRSFKQGAIQTIEFVPEGESHSLSVFARKGKKIVLMDRSLANDFTVGDVNELFLDTNLYSQSQYSAVNAKTWADKAFVNNF